MSAPTEHWVPRTCCVSYPGQDHTSMCRLNAMEHKRLAEKERQDGKVPSSDHTITNKVFAQVTEAGRHKVERCKRCNLTVHSTQCCQYFTKTKELIAPLCAPCYKVLEREEQTAVKEQPSILVEAEQIINGQRRVDYGNCSTSFQRIADLWTITLGFKVSPQAVALCLIQLKIARSLQDVDSDRPVKRDSIVDIAGYAGCLEKIGKGE